MYISHEQVSAFEDLSKVLLHLVQPVRGPLKLLRYVDIAKKVIKVRGTM